VANATGFASPRRPSRPGRWRTSPRSWCRASPSSTGPPSPRAARTGTTGSAPPPSEADAPQVDCRAAGEWSPLRVVAVDLATDVSDAHQDEAPAPDLPAGYRPPAAGGRGSDVATARISSVVRGWDEVTAAAAPGSDLRDSDGIAAARTLLSLGGTRPP